MMTLPTIALIYDFDGTLTPGNMQEYGFISSLNKQEDQFWNEVNKFKKQYNLDDDVLAYMYFMIQAAQEHQIPITREDFQKMGQRICFFKGVEAWFQSLEQRWSPHFQLKHYVISSGLEEMIEGCAIRDVFEKVYACKFIYDEYGKPFWPGRVINFTNKTQYLFRINKGTDDPQKLNEYLCEQDRPIPFRQMIYFGDGPTDIPCMRLVKEGKGHVFALYGAKKDQPTDASLKQEARQLVQDGRADMALEADFSEASALFSATEDVLDLLRAELRLSKRLKTQRSEDLHAQEDELSN